MSVNLSSQKIIKDWIDYNGHMNVAYYLLIFDKYGADNLNTIFKMGEHSAKTTKKSTMVVETHTTYNQEVKEGDEVEIFGEQISVQQVAEWCNTIPYEIMTTISQRVKRVYIEE